MLYLILLLIIFLLIYSFIAIIGVSLKDQIDSNNQKDLVIDDNNTITKGSVVSNQHPLSTRTRPMPTWMDR